MSVGGRIVKRLARGYRRVGGGQPETFRLQPMQVPSQIPAQTQYPMPGQYPMMVQAQQPLPVMQASPMEVKGKLELVRPEREKLEIEGYEVPAFRRRNVGVARIKSRMEKEIISGTYPLIPDKPKREEPIFAYANIFWNAAENSYVYQVVEPQLTPKLQGMLAKVKELLEQRLDVDFSKLKRFEAREYLKNQINEIMGYFEMQISGTERQILQYYIERDFIGLGKIEPMMRDPRIEDISCDGVGVPIFIFHRDPKLGSVKTNISYDEADELDSFITRLAQLCGKSISVAQPLVDGALPDGSRLQATLATDIARRGSNFTIRKFTETPLTPTDLLSYGTLGIEAMAFLWFMVDYGSSILVSGGTASGKTSLLNVLSLFIRPEKKIISIEDTAELQLPHPHWVPAVARTSIAEEGKESEIDLFTLLKESLRQRPDYIIVGEVRGREAYILFQQMATGHPSLATIHAENMPKLIDRLTTPPISLSPGLLGSLDLVVFLNKMKYKEKFMRRVTEIIELLGYDEDAKEPIANVIFKWDSEGDKFDALGKSVMLKKVADRSGLKENEMREELERRMVVLKWMKDNEIKNYVDVAKVINSYYNYPRETLGMMLG